MTINGQFRDIDNNLITVAISSSKSGDDITIGENGLYFTEQPVVISYSIDDSFETIIRKSCTINLATKDYLGDKLFSLNSRDITVTVTKGGGLVVFSGYLSPNTFSQPFVRGLDTFELQAVDYLSTLQYYNYKNTTVKNYNDNKATISTVTFKSILQSIFGNRNVFYDKSKGIDNSSVNTVFADIAINDSIFYGDDADDLKTQEEVLDSILKYLNLHIIQQGNNFYIFDWDSIKNGTIQNWIHVTNSGTNTGYVSNTININKDLFAAADTNISIADVYNQIGLTCNLEAQETVIESPLSNDNISPLYNGRMKYMTEYISNGNGDSANDAFNAAVKGNTTDYDGFKTIDWYCQVMQNPKWKFNVGNNQTIEDIAEKDSSGYINQYKIPLYLKNNQCKPALIRFGSVTTEGGENKDNNPQSKIDMKNYLFISVNGDEANTTSYTPTESTLQSAAPLIEYIDYSNGGNFSPADSKTTNYLVFSGKLLLQPIAYETGISLATRQNTYQTLQNNNARKYKGESPGCPIYENASDLHNNLVSNDYDDDGRYYTRKFYYDNPSSYMNAASLQPWTANKGERGYEYNYSANGDSSDKYSKLPVLECELIIGTKRLIETNIDMYGNSIFQWVPVGQEPSLDGQKKTTFSLGVNPKIGDKIIGTEFPIQNTISYELNIDAEGTGIPITREDAINGQVTFRILGLVNTLWNDITRRHPSFWRHTSWSSDSRPILAHTENVIIQDFQCKLYSNNALNSNDGSDELIYKSAESDNYITSKDDIEFDIVTQLTSDECLAKGITTAANKNAALFSSDGLTLHDIYNKNSGELDIAEKHYIDQYYREYSIPRMILETTIHGIPTFPTIYNWNTLQKEFIVYGMESDIRMNTTKLTLKEI